LLYDGPLLCGFNVAIKGLSTSKTQQNGPECALSQNTRLYVAKECSLVCL